MENKVYKFKKIASEIGDLYEKKNKDYGDSFGQTFDKLGLLSAITRISDKYNRIVSLATSNDLQIKSETIEDTLKDLAAYSIMTIIALDEHKNINNK